MYNTMVPVGLEYNATQQPNIYNIDPGSLNMVLRFANTTWWWSILSFIQWLWKTTLAERYLGEPPEQVFIDLCTIAKISVLVLESKYHGYYLHCRSPHQFSDGSMAELVEMLHKEEAGLTIDRSLEGAPQDVQSFEVYLSGEWRLAFDKIYKKMVRPPSVNEILSAGRIYKKSSPLARMFSTPSTPLPPERVMRSWAEMTLFLQDFVDNNFSKLGFKRTVVEPTYMQKMLRQAPGLALANQPSIFYPDKEFQYCRTMFLGRETDLLVFNILCYSVLDMWFNSTAASILITYLVNCCLVWWRRALGQATIARKTLIDERFLI